MRPITLLFLAFLPFFTFFSQTEKGAAPLQSSGSTPPSSQTRAVVIGISDYQSPQIQDLRFAHRDAEAFVNWLRSPAGGNIPEENIRLLANEKATIARLGAELDWLVESSQEGDQAIIYFSGHGDVETKTKFNRGFLLCHDSPPTNYAAGVFHLTYLQDVVTTLSEGKVKTIVIADACRSGNLAGNSVGGSQATAANLAKQFAHEIKILSCQPNEYSIEGEQWGGGRGAFSYHLTDGLYGFADGNDDRSVNLLEIQRYLQDKVTIEVAPMSQIPMVYGNMAERIALVNEKALAEYKAGKTRQKKILSSAEMRGLEDVTLAQVDSVTRQKYHAFKATLAAKNFFDTAETCADTLYRQLADVPGLKPLHSAMRRNYAAALQDEVQQALNALLADDPYESNNWLYKPEKYADYPNYLKRAIELLGKEHYTYPLLFAQQRYFEAYLLLKNGSTNLWGIVLLDSVRATAKQMLLEAAAYAPDAAYIFHTIGSLYYYNTPSAIDSLLKYTTKAIDLAPHWLMPYLQIFEEYRNSNGDFNELYKWLDAAIEQKPDSYQLLEKISWLYQAYNRYDEADSLCQIMIAMKPDLFNPWATMGQSHFVKKDYENAIRYYQKALELEPGKSNWSWIFIGCAYLHCRKEKEGFEYYRQAWAQDINGEELHIGLADYFFSSNRYAEAMPVISRLRKNSTMSFATAISYRLEGAIRVQEGKWEEAEALLKQALITDPTPDISDVLARTWLGVLESRLGHYAKADSLFRDAFRYPGLDFTWGHDEAHAHYGDFLLNQNRLAEAQIQYEQSIKILPLGYMGYYGLARLAAKKGNQTAALDYLEKALDRWYPIPQPIMEEPLFKKIQKTKRFKALMKKHFPDSQ